MCANFWLASEGQASWGNEGTAYSQASNSTSYFGLIETDLEFPNPNPYTPIATGGERRGPHVLSPDPKEYNFTVTFLPVDHTLPLHAALGSRTQEAHGGGKSYTSHLWTEADLLPTVTVEHAQQDQGSAKLQEYFVGCKANLTISWSQGDPVEFSMDFTGTSQETAASASFPSLSVPQDKNPYHHNHLQKIEVTRTSDGSSVKTVETNNSGDLSWDNGLEVRHHGAGRDGYAVVETTSGDKYDMSFEIDVTDLTLFNEAKDDNALVDVEFIFDRDTGVDGEQLRIRLLECKVVSAPVDNPSDGAVTGTVEVQPRDTEIEIRENT